MKKESEALYDLEYLTSPNLTFFTYKVLILGHIIIGSIYKIDLNVFSAF